MARKGSKWMQRAFSKHPGALHQELGIPLGKKIPLRLLEQKAHSKPKTAKGLRTKRRAVAALTARRIQARRRKGKK